MKKELSTRLKNWRKRLNISQAEASGRLGVALRTYQKWEQGTNAPRGLGRAALEKVVA